jgi:hypothetical protein
MLGIDFSAVCCCGTFSTRSGASASSCTRSGIDNRLLRYQVDDHYRGSETDDLEFHKGYDDHSHMSFDHSPIGVFMLAAVANVQRLDWSGWLRGIIGAIISGGAGSITAGGAVTFADPSHDISIFKVMWITFLGSGIISLAKYLQTQPIPGQLQHSLESAAIASAQTSSAIAAAQANTPPKP